MVTRSRAFLRRRRIGAVEGSEDVPVSDQGEDYPARKARALRALGLLLADGALTVGWDKTLWCVGRVPSRKRP